MGKRVKDTSKSAPKIRDPRRKKKRVFDPVEIGKKLGADYYIDLNTGKRHNLPKKKKKT